MNKYAQKYRELILKSWAPVRRISKPLNDYFDGKRGYIQYRKAALIKKFGEVEVVNILNNRIWHSNEKVNETYKKELHGKDFDYLYINNVRHIDFK